MIYKQIHKHFPFSKLFKLVLGMAVVLQVVVISYNNFTGYHELHSFSEIILRVIRGIFYSTIAGFAIAYPDIFVIQYLNKKIHWNKGTFKRVAIQFLFMLIIAVIVSTLLTSFAHWVSKYPQGLRNVLFNNALIYIVVNAFFMSILEAWIYLDESIHEKIKAEQLNKKLINEASNRVKVEAQIKFEEEKNKFNRLMIEQEKELNRHLGEEIKKREALAKELNESREQLNSILFNLPGAAYRCYFDEDYTMKYISEKIFEITGYHASEIMKNGKVSFEQIIHEQDKELCRNTIRNAIKNQKHYEIEYRLLHKNGSIIWVSESGKGIFNQSGELGYLDGIIIDITPRRLAEIAVTESKRNFKELMDMLPQPIFELDILGNILFLNKSGQEYFGVQIPENPEKKISALDLMIPDDVSRVKENIKKSNQDNLSTPNEYTVRRPDGTQSPVLIYGSPIIRNNRVVGRRGIIIDITERKKQEKKLLKAKEELEQINDSLEQRVAERTQQLTEANTQLLKVQKENLQSQFEVLKQQVNPHFLFNSLNVLTSLIKVDADMAESFTERLSKVYRYVLENKDKELVCLSTEIEFLNSYLFLLEIRFRKKLFIEIKIEKSYNDYQILPIAIQLVIENAIKHNTFSKAEPLRIDIFVDDDLRLNIVNNLNLRESKFVSTGVGLENIKRRYALVSDQIPEFVKTTQHFIAKLPLIKTEKKEIE